MGLPQYLPHRRVFLRSRCQRNFNTSNKLPRSLFSSQVPPDYLARIRRVVSLQVDHRRAWLQVVSLKAVRTRA